MDYQHGISRVELDFRNTMRMLWEEHVAWTRMVIISIAEGLADLEPVTKRLLRNPLDFEAVLIPFYGEEKASEFTKLFTDHLIIAAELVTAAKAHDCTAVTDAETRWFANADQIAVFLNNINPYFSREAFMAMLHEHLILTENEAIARLNRDYTKDIALYDMVEAQALVMADMMASGIIRQFTERFRCEYKIMS